MKYNYRVVLFFFIFEEKGGSLLSIKQGSAFRIIYFPRNVNSHDTYRAKLELV